MSFIIAGRRVRSEVWVGNEYATKKLELINKKDKLLLFILMTNDDKKQRNRALKLHFM